MDARSVAANLVGAVVNDPVKDAVALEEYLETTPPAPMDPWSGVLQRANLVRESTDRHT
jgi:hypothetical protein